MMLYVEQLESRIAPNQFSIDLLPKTLFTPLLYNTEIKGIRNLECYIDEHKNSIHIGTNRSQTNTN